MRSSAVEVLRGTKVGEGNSWVGVARSKTRSRVIILVPGLGKLEPSKLERLASRRLKARELESGSMSTLTSR